MHTVTGWNLEFPVRESALPPPKPKNPHSQLWPLVTQMAANLRDGGRHRRKTLRELFADGRAGPAPPTAFPLDRIIRAGSESAALEVRSAKP